MLDHLLAMQPPVAWSGFKLPTPHVMQVIDRIANRHIEGEEGGDDDAELTTSVFPLCVSEGPVRPHIDQFDGSERDKMIFGLVLRSDGHTLHTEQNRAGIPLVSGMVYRLHPYDRHWTTAQSGRDRLYFAASFLPPHDPRYWNPANLANDLLWSTMTAALDWEAKVEPLFDPVAFVLARDLKPD